MALPRSITGAIDTWPLGQPFMTVYNSKYYLITGGGVARVYSPGTNPDSTWSELDSSNARGLGSSNSYACCQSGRYLHVVGFYYRTLNYCYANYGRFDMETETWVTSEADQVSLNYGDSMPGAVRPLAVAARSDHSIVMFWQVWDDVGGTDYIKMYAIPRYTGGSPWDEFYAWPDFSKAYGTGGANLTKDLVPMMAMTGADDTIYVFVSDAIDSDSYRLYVREFSTGDTWGTETVVDDNGGGNYFIDQPLHGAPAADISDVFYFPYFAQDDNVAYKGLIKSAHFDASGTPSYTVGTALSANDYILPTGLGSAVNADGTAFFVWHYLEGSNYKTYVAKNLTSSTWDTPILVRNTTTNYGAELGPAVYNAATGTIGYITFNEDEMYYDEYQAVVIPSLTADVVVSATPDADAIWQASLSANIALSVEAISSIRGFVVNDVVVSAGPWETRVDRPATLTAPVTVSSTPLGGFDQPGTATAAIVVSMTAWAFEWFEQQDTFSLTDTFEGTLKWIFSDIIEFSDAMQQNQLLAIADSMAFASAFSRVLVQTQYEISDTVEFTDRMRHIVLQTLTDTFALSDTIEIGSILAIIADTFKVSDSFLDLITKEIEISDSVLFTDGSTLNYRLEWSDTISFVDTILDKIRFILSVTDTISFTDAFANSFLMELTISDEFEVSDSFAETIQAVLSISDTFSMTGLVRIDGELYMVWGLNPQSAGAYKLKYPMNINSIERIGGKNLLCADTGIYEVTGEDDDGAEIAALLKTGYEDFDDPERHYPGEKLKQLLNAYLVMTADGDTLLKVRTTRRGEIIETWFKCREHPTAMSKKMIPLSNSLRSLLFQFEIIPMKGKPMKIREAEVIPLFLTRSY